MKKKNIVKKMETGHKRHITQPFVIVGGIIEKDDKYLFIKQDKKWNHPCGWLELGESLEKGAKREIEEETGLEVELTKYIGTYTLIKNKADKKLHAVKIMFKAKLTGKKVLNSEELDLEWMNYDQVKKNKDKFWDPDVVDIIKDVKKNSIYSLSVVTQYLKTS